MIFFHFCPFSFSRHEGGYESSASFHFTQQKKKKDLRSGLVLQTEALMQKLKLELETTNFNLGWATPCFSGKPKKPHKQCERGECISVSENSTVLLLPTNNQQTPC